MEALWREEREGVREEHAFSGSNPTQSWRLEMQMYVNAGNPRHSHHYTTNISSSRDWTYAQVPAQIA